MNRTKTAIRLVAFALVLSGAGALACNVLNPVVCTLEYAYGLFGSVTDPSGAPVPGLSVTIVSGTYMEDAVILNGTDYVGAGEREGTYRIIFAAPGFQSRTVSNVAVTSDQCHVTPVRVDAVLMPEQG